MPSQCDGCPFGWTIVRVTKAADRIDIRRTDRRLHAAGNRTWAEAQRANAIFAVFLMDLTHHHLDSCLGGAIMAPAFHRRVRRAGIQRNDRAAAARHACGSLSTKRAIGTIAPALLIRISSAKVIAETPAGDKVAFGNTVSFRREDGGEQVYKIVGEDEANPMTGSIAYVSPVARALLDKYVGDKVAVGSSELEIIEIT